MTKLSVNINKIATLRNSRGGLLPNVVKFAIDCESFGAEGITVHPRPDERHITYQDVRDLSPVVKTEFNVEGYPNKKFIELVCEVKCHQVTLVPDPPGALTSNAGWDVKANLEFLTEVIAKFKKHGIRTSIFVDTNHENLEYAKKSGADRVEFYTEPYCDEYVIDKEKAVKPFVDAALKAKELGLGINAGHDLNLENLAYLKENIPFMDEVSIGHALVADSLYLGIENTIQMYRKCLLEKE